MNGSGSGTLILAQASAIGSSIGRTRSPSRLRICSNQRIKGLGLSRDRPVASTRSLDGISARTTTLVPISGDGAVSSTQRATFG